jgi:site-specific DNA-methyltransferase (adenine-specific)
MYENHAKENHAKEIRTEFHLGDCLEVLTQFPDNTFDLIITSPPYADSRTNTYGGIKPDQYVEWFLPRSKELLRVLKPDGTFILNIKEKAVNGERHTYVIELILALRQQGWFWTEEFIWHKKNCYPGKWPNRFRDAWERCLQFNKSKKFKMYQESVMVPMGNWAESRLKKLSETDRTRDESKVGSGFGKKISNWVGKQMVYPTNVLHLATECGNKNHSAAFPKALPEWFIKLFTQENDWVLDPFAGSGTTCHVAQSIGRNSVGIEVLPENHQLALNNQQPIQKTLFEEKASYAIDLSAGNH